MAKAKTETQRQRFIEAAKELGADDNEQSFRSAIRKIATASVAKAKKNAKKTTRPEGRVASEDVP